MIDDKSTSTPLVANEKLEKENVAKKSNVTKFKNLIGCLLYLLTIRLDIMHAISLLSMLMHSSNDCNTSSKKIPKIHSRDCRVKNLVQESK